MKISYKWLQEYVEIDVSPEKLVELLTMHSFEVENIIYQGAGLKNVIVGKVLEKEKHPNADRLNVVKVEIDDNQVSEIVCGAPNIEVGQKVLVAKLGAELPCGLKIEKRKVRGVESSGMVCAEDELGLGENHEGIMILEDNLKIGMSAEEVLGLDDVIFEIDILPNRAHDCLSHFGVAREVAVLLGKKLKNNYYSEDNNICKKSEEIKIENKELCRRYSSVILDDIQVKESPDWIKNKLKICDVRSINNIVDITNLVMFSIGQPMHVFDADKIEGEIIIRNAQDGEKIIALDENEYKLQKDDLVIADREKVIAIAGVMGGLETAVTGKTKKIVFESANFKGSNVRKTSQRLRLSSESSYRFEREIDSEITIQAIEMAKELAGGTIQGNIIDLYPTKEKEKEIKFNFNKIENLLGLIIEKKRVEEILNSLGFKVTVSGENLEVIIPTYRKDITMVNNVIEEIGRINGYQNIEEIPAIIKMKSVIQDKTLLMEKDFRKVLEGFEFFEVYNYSFLGEKEIKGIGFDIENHFELQNPLSEDFKFMRTSLLPDLLNNTKNNLKYRNKFKLFELGKIYLRNNNQEPNEKKIIAGIWVNRERKETLFYSLKEELNILIRKLSNENSFYQKIDSPENFWHKGRSAEIVIGKQIVGKIGEIHPVVLSAFGLEERVMYFEFYLEKMAKFYSKEKGYQQINKFPQADLDLSVIFSEDVQWGNIKKVILKVGGNLIKKIEPFDIYRGENLGENKKSIAFKISYQATDKTLNDEEIKVIQGKIIKELENLGGEIRK